VDQPIVNSFYFHINFRISLSRPEKKKKKSQLENLPSKPEALSSNPCTIKEKKKKKFARHQCLTPVTLASLEAEIRRIMVQSQPGQSLGDPISKKTITKKG
jgi:hypothetical protein